MKSRFLKGKQFVSSLFSRFSSLKDADWAVKTETAIRKYSTFLLNGLKHGAHGLKWFFQNLKSSLSNINLVRPISSASIWIWCIIAIPILLILWSISIIVSVNNDREAADENVQLMNRLNSLEHSLRGLDRNAKNQKPFTESSSADEYWLALYTDYREKLEAIDLESKSAARIAPTITAVDSLVRRMESLHIGALSVTGDLTELNSIESNFYQEKNLAINKVKEAIRSVRQYQSEISFHLTDQWQKSNFLVLLSCILAMALAVLLKLFQQNQVKQEKTNASLLETQKKYRTLLENISELITVANPNGEIVHISQNSLEFTGYTAKERIGKSFFDKIYPADQDDARNVFLEMLDSEKPISTTFRFMHRNGNTFWFEARGNHFIDVDGAKRVIIIGRDISKRKKLEGQLLQARKIEAIGTLAGGIAHDFNNILASIMGYTELARDDLPEDHIAQERLAHVQQASLRGKALVNQILTFRREKKTDRSPVNIEGTVKEAVKLLQASAPSTIKVMEHIHTNCGHILANSTQIHQVVMNLGTNAIHAMQNRGGILDIILMPIKIGAERNKIDADLEEGPYVQLTLRDTGHGMDNVTKERIFDPFFTTKSVKQGTGMGLSVVHAIVENHDGKIVVESEPGQGTSFNIYFPQIQQKQAAFIPEINHISPKNKRILFIDDEEMLLQTSKQMLERLGYKVTIDTNSQKALELFREKPASFDLVITDQVMPYMMGEELAQELFRIRPDLPVILMTGYSETISSEKAEQIGIAEMLIKPASSRQLDETIRRILGREEKHAAKA